MAYPAPPRRLAPRAALALAALAAAPSIASCSGDEPEELAFGLLLTPGQERDAWGREPAPASVVVKARVSSQASPTEQEIVLAEQPWPFDALSTEGLTPGAIAVISAEVRDAAGALVMRGESPVIVTDEGFGRELPLLVARVGEFSRPEQKVVGAWPSPKPVLIDGRYILLAGGGGEGAAGGAELFDLVRLAPLLWTGVLPRAPSSVLTSDGATALLVNEEGASLYNFLAGTQSEIVLSAGNARALAGGESVLSDAETGEAFIVGATRAGDPTTAVLRAAKGANPEVIELATARERASAIWVEGRGLVVGGVADAAGAPLAPQRLPLSCPDACPAAAEALTLPPLRDGRSFDVGRPNTRIVIGADDQGFVSARLVDTTNTPASVTAVATRVQRKGGAALSVGGGFVAIVGGADAAGAPVQDVELYTPAPP